MNPIRDANKITDYPLPPTEQKTEILRVVVRESMSADLLERLISDTVAVTERLVDSDPVDLSSLQSNHHGINQHSRSQVHGQQDHHAPASRMKKMGEGVHKTVC